MTEAEVVVLGGGVSGSVAAIASARNGAKTLLVERYGFLGGTATAALVAPMAPFHSKRGEQVIAGIPQEIIDSLKDLGGAIGHVVDTIGAAGSITPYDPELLKIVLQQLACSSGVEFLYHTWAAEVALDGKRIKEIIVANKRGLGKVIGKVYVDATGDGDVAAKAGALFEIGSQGDEKGCQPMTLIFKLGGVVVSDLIEYCLLHKEEFHKGTLFDTLSTAPIIGLSGFFTLWKEAFDKGDVSIPRDRVLLFTTLRKGEVLINTGRVSGKIGIDPFELTEAELEAREQILPLVRFLQRYVPGFKDSYLLQSGMQIGVRETRRIIGEYCLTADDVINGQTFPDGVAKGAWPIDIHDPKGKGVIMRDIHEGGAYDIPYRSLYSKQVENLLVAGRCISASHEASASSRVMPTSMAVGQAAGTASAMAVLLDGKVASIDIEKLREALLRQGAII